MRIRYARVNASNSTGRDALVSLSEVDGVPVVYDAQTSNEAGRLPTKRPMGDRNVCNKIKRSELASQWYGQ